MSRVNKTEKYLNTLSNAHQDMLVLYRQHLNKIRYCIDENNQIIRKIIQDVDKLFENENRTVVKPDTNQDALVRDMDLDKVSSFVSIKKDHDWNIVFYYQVQVTLKQFARDWSSDGEEERTQCYKPIIDEIMHHYNPREM